MSIGFLYSLIGIFFMMDRYSVILNPNNNDFLLDKVQYI